MIRELNSSDKDGIRTILKSRNHIFTGHEFDFNAYLPTITSDAHFRNDMFVNLGLFENDILERFVLLFKLGNLGITVFLCSMKKPKNNIGWDKNYDLFVNEIIETHIRRGVDVFYYLSSTGFNDETKNEGVPAFKKFDVEVFDLKAGDINYNGPNKEFVEKYVIGSVPYKEDLYIKQLTLKKDII